MKRVGQITLSSVLSVAAWIALASVTNAQAADARQTLQEAQKLYNSGQYFSAARYAYGAGQGAGVSAGESNSWVALSLMKAGLYNSATYFFIKTLESGD